jgi:hypothetical protein
MSLTIGAGLTALIANTPPGTTLLFTGAPKLEPALLKFQNKHRVTTIVGTAPGSVPIAGDVYAENGTNVELEIEPSNNVLRINAAPGIGKGFPPGRATLERPSCNEILMLLNGLTADNAGDFMITGEQGIVVVADPVNHQLIIRPAEAADEMTQECGT